MQFIKCILVFDDDFPQFKLFSIEIDIFYKSTSLVIVLKRYYRESF
jgi:hypothetical protein